MIRVICFLLLLFAIGCTVQRSSKFTSEKVKPGMTKKEVIALYGKPYKQSTSIDSNHVLHEDYYYKEQLFLRSKWYEVNNILHFQNEVLTSLQQGEEKLLYQNDRIMVK